MKKVAGIIVFNPRKSGLQVLLVKERKTNNWSLPKGKVELNETSLMAALRETEEETGLVVTKAKRLRPLQISEKGKRVYFFIAHVTDTVRTSPNKAEIIKAKFVPLEKAIKLLCGYQQTLLISTQRIYAP
jgi:8-oxo-dGTP pyrophosphatase MutT (NUDIX family)